MKERILTGWTFIRLFYAVIGSLLVIKAVTNHVWFLALLGCYFASMGILAFGCASGNCVGGNCNIKPKEIQRLEIDDLEFQAIKQK